MFESLPFRREECDEHVRRTLFLWQSNLIGKALFVNSSVVRVALGKIY